MGTCCWNGVGTTSGSIVDSLSLVPSAAPRVVQTGALVQRVLLPLVKSGDCTLAEGVGLWVGPGQGLGAPGARGRRQHEIR